MSTIIKKHDDAHTTSQIRHSSEITEQLNVSPARRDAESEQSLLQRYRIKRATPFASQISATAGELQAAAAPYDDDWQLPANCRGSQSQTALA